MRIALILILAALLAGGCETRPPAAAAPDIPGPYYEGDGGKDIRLAVLQPEGAGLASGEEWLLALIQGTLTGCFNKYSAMTVVDRQNLDKILAEQNHSLSGVYSDEDFISIGNLTNARYILSGSITKTGGAVFILELSISDLESGERRASWPPGACTLDELREMTVLQGAAADLLEQMGVRLTGQGRAALATVRASQAASEAALSKGLVAQRNGDVVEAMSYYYDAVSFDAAQIEAEGRLSALSADVSRGNIGQSIRNEIERRNVWLKALTECEDFFSGHLPYELVYDPELSRERINWDTERVDLSFVIVSYPTQGFSIIKSISDGLTATGKKAEWGFSQWPLHSTVFVDEPGGDTLGKTMTVTAELVNEGGEVLAVKTISLVNAVGRNLSSRAAGATVVFRDLNIRDLTGEPMVRITGVNGVDVDTAGRIGYIKISARAIDKKQWPIRRDLVQNRQ
jgi:hypothetical protein